MNLHNRKLLFNMEIKIVAALILLIVIAIGEAGWQRYHESCYYISHDTEEWHIAQWACKAYGAALAEINSVGENSFITSEIASRNFPYAWLGGNDLEVEGSWLWAGSDTAMTYTNWNTNEPSNGGHNEHCLMLLSGSSKWNDDVCSDKFHYVCEMTDDTVEPIVG